MTLGHLKQPLMAMPRRYSTLDPWHNEYSTYWLSVKGTVALDESGLSRKGLLRAFCETREAT
jgi:hypothetical protein